MKGKMHLIDTFRWSKDSEVRVADMIVASIRMVLPIALSAPAGKLPLGMAISLGAMMASSSSITSEPQQPFRELISTVSVPACAGFAATFVVGHGWETVAAVLGAVSVAALLGGYSRSMAQATTRFILFFVIVTHAAAETSHRTGLLFLVITGALWAGALRVVSERLVRRRKHITLSPVTTVLRVATTRQNRQRWGRSLTALAGWQYTFRIALCVAFGSFMQSQWPDHHFYWIAIISVILTRRQIEVLPVQATQRAIGTILGVLIAYPLLIYNSSGWGVAIDVAILSAVRPLFKARNYLAYSMVMTSLILLILANAEPLRPAIFYDRVSATMLGIAAVIILNLLFIGTIPRRSETGAPS